MMFYLVLAVVVATVSAHHERVGASASPCTALPTPMGSGVKSQISDEAPLSAVVKLQGTGIEGKITFTQQADEKVHVVGTITGLPPGHYGFHVHEKGDITGGCGSTGSHYNPEHKDHGHPTDENRHVGDLGNVVFDQNRVANIDFIDGFISLHGAHSIIGRGVVLHEKADDFGRSDHPDSKKTGNAGGRVACGVIGVL